MALINCPNCNGTVSDKATFCPHCDFELQAQQQEAPQPEASKKKLTFVEKIRSIKTWKLITPLIAIIVICISIVAYGVYSDYVDSMHKKDCANGKHTYDLKIKVERCLTNGQYYYECEYCGHYYIEKGDYIYHNYGDNGICSNCGFKRSN